MGISVIWLCLKIEDPANWQFCVEKDQSSPHGTSKSRELLGHLQVLNCYAIQSVGQAR
jgi:hypothetical protein